MNLLGIYAFIFIIVWVILGIKLEFKKVSYLKSIGITITIIILGFLSGIIPTHIGKSGDKAFYTYNIYKTANIYGKGSAYADVPSGVKKVIVHDGIEVFGTCMGYEKLENIKMANSVTEIGGISNCSSLKEIVLPSNLKIIGDLSFSECKSLENIVIPETVEKIGAMAFYNCSSLQSIQLPKTLKVIEQSTFSGCSSLDSIEIPKTVEQICCNAFNSTKITEIYLPDNTLINLEEQSDGGYMEAYKGKTFYYCENLEKINISENNNNYIDIDGVIFDINKTKIVSYPQNRPGEKYIVPDSVNDLESYTFAFCNNLQEITVSGNVEGISARAIYECENLKELRIENGVKKISEDAIEECYKLSDIYIPDSVTEIDGKITLGDKVTIHCSKNSFAHQYAEYYGYNYVINED